MIVSFSFLRFCLSAKTIDDLDSPFLFDFHELLIQKNKSIPFCKIKQHLKNNIIDYCEEKNIELELVKTNSTIKFTKFSKNILYLIDFPMQLQSANFKVDLHFWQLKGYLNFIKEPIDIKILQYPIRWKLGLFRKI